MSAPGGRPGWGPADWGSPEEPQSVVIRDRRRIDPETGEVRAATDPATGAPAPGVGQAGPGAATADQPGIEALRSQVVELEQQLGERTEDVQRVQAQFVNFRRRTERESAELGERIAAGVLATMLPVLDDIDRARAHGDLNGAFRAVAEGLEQIVGKHGLERFGATGDPFDPSVHEAVTHSLSDDVAEPTCAAVLRPGYRIGDKLLRAAMVAVVEPTDPSLDGMPEPERGPATVSDPDGAAGSDRADGWDGADGSDRA